MCDKQLVEIQFASCRVRQVQRNMANFTVASFLLGLLPINSIQESESRLALCQPASNPHCCPALKSPALILGINKPCAEQCSQRRLFSAPLCFFLPSSSVRNVFIKNVSPSQALANRACLSSITDPSRNQLESWRCCAAIRPLTTWEKISLGFKISRFV